jgi:hypothetical protein
MTKLVTAVAAAAAALMLSPALTHAASDEALVKDAIVATLKQAIAADLDVDVDADAEADAEALGVENCLNKCQNVFDNTQFAIQTQGSSTFESEACKAGCKICATQIANKDKDGGACFKTCKNTNWLDMKDEQGNPVVVVKGVIEPDKACEMGCVIQTCQVVCTGGTTDMKVTHANRKFFWPAPDGCPGNKGATCGCSIKTGAVRPGGFYAQNGEYNFWNSGQAGAGGASECCSNAVNICNYAGNKKSKNYSNAVKQAQNYCADVPGVGPHASVNTICNWASLPGNCGTST